MTGYPCPNKLCPNYGKQCWKCCNSCGKEIFWRPPLLDKEIAYNGPKPLNKDASLHRCMRGGVKQYKRITGDKIIDSINASKELYDFLKRIRFSSPFRSEVISNNLWKEWIRNNSASLIVLGIGLAISFVIAGGNIDALARSKR